VWTLTRPEESFAEWFRILKPGGLLLFFDGDWASPKPTGRIASLLITWIDRFIGADSNYDGALSTRHARIMSALPFGSGLRPDMLLPLLRPAGFTGIELHSHAPITRAQRKNANLRNKLRTLVYRRFILTCRRP
ncbi:MAG: SAM-dependent methyltransferase, partial [Rhizobium sp.]